MADVRLQDKLWTWSVLANRRKDRYAASVLCLDWHPFVCLGAEPTAEALAQKKVQTKNLASFSQAHDVLVCRVDERVMASSSELWGSGVRKWRISHLGEDGASGLETGGELPECFESIREELEATQRAEGGDDADVDYIFEIPLKVAQKLVGFKHDEDWESTVVDGFETLSGGKQRFFARLFGR